MFGVSKAGAGLSRREEVQHNHTTMTTTHLRAVDEKEPALYLQIETYILI